MGGSAWTPTQSHREVKQNQTSHRPGNSKRRCMEGQTPPGSLQHSGASDRPTAHRKPEASSEKAVGPWNKAGPSPSLWDSHIVDICSESPGGCHVLGAQQGE